MRWILLWCALALLTGPAPAEPLTPPAKKAAQPPATGWMKVVQEAMTGQPVVAVGYGNRPGDPTQDAPKITGSMLEKLQALAVLGGSEEDPLIPFAIRETWALAPETRDEVNTDLSRLTPFQAMARGELMNRALGSLTPAAVNSLSQPTGVPLGRLPTETRDYLLGAFRPPLAVGRNVRKTFTIGERVIDGTQREAMLQITEPLDPARVRVRARLWERGVSFDLGSGQGGTAWSPQEGPALRPSGDKPPSHEPYELPALSSVPNTFKPSDLDGKTLTAPIGISGLWHLKDVLDRAAKVTGLRFTAHEIYGGQPVFLGRDDIPTGDVLDAVRLALRASFRKMGDAYVLAWDRRGLGALQQTVADATFPIMKPLKEMERETWSASGWLALAERLPFDPDDPFALSDAQRKELTQAPKPGDEVGPRIPFSEMTPEQQDALRKRASGEEITYFDNTTHEMKTHRVTDQDFAGAFLSGTFEVQLEVDLPGFGWVRTEWFGQDLLQRLHFDRARAKESDKPNEMERDIAEFRREMAAMEPRSMPAAFRALAVSALSPARVAEVVQQMKRHDLNVLFYPVLYGGYATFPNSAFPLHPALRGADGWAAAEAATKAAGIRLIGYMEMLAWQRAGDRAHWLNRHPDWVDVDRAGMPRLRWLEAHPEFDANHKQVGTMANYVRASEPEVKRRLSTLLTAFTAKKGAAGLAIADWEPGTDAERYDNQIPLPDLGFAMADRLASVRATGRDPIDAPYYVRPGEQPFRPRGPIVFMWTGEAPKKSEGARMAERLLAVAKKRRPDWMTCLLDDSTDTFVDGEIRKKNRMPQADITFTTDYANGGTPVDDHIERFRPLPKDGSPPKVADMARVVANWNRIPDEGARTRGRIILDLRDAPERLDEILRWVLPASAKAPRPQ